MSAVAAITDYSLDAEQALLGAVLLDSSIIDALDGSVTPDDFAEPLHAQLFQLMVECRAEGRAFNPKLFVTMLGKTATDKIDGTDKTIGQYLASLAASSPGPAMARDYARVVVENASYRKLAAAGQRLNELAKARHAAGKPGAIAAEIISELDCVVSASISGAVRRMSIGDAAWEAIQQSQDRKNNGNKIGLPWPVKDLNAATLGMHPGDLIIVAARPSMGKSTFGLSTAVHLATEGHGVVLVSLEMGASALAERALADLVHRRGRTVSYIDIRAGRFDDAEANAVIEAYDQLKRIPLMIEQQGGLSVAQIAARVRSVAVSMENDGHKLKALVVDHLGLVAASNRYAGARHSELGEITSALKALAKELGIAVVLLSQLNRAVESRENKRPTLADLRESGRIEEDADTVMMLYREAYYLERTTETDAEKEIMRHQRLLEVQNVLEINIAKQRQGPTTNVQCFVSMPCNAIRDLERRYG